MAEANLTNLATGLIGRPVLDPVTARLRGRVKNVALGASPADWLALFWQTPGGSSQAALHQHCQLIQQPEAVLVLQCYVLDGEELAAHLNEANTAQTALRFAEFTNEGENDETDHAENLVGGNVCRNVA